MPEEPDGLTIGQTLNLLGAEFPDLTSSKLRYWDRIGLVSPSRTDGKYRVYKTEEIEKLRFVLKCQTERQLPLNQIKQQLSLRNLNSDEMSDGRELWRDEDHPPEPINRTTLRIESGLHPHRLAAVISAGLIPQLAGHPHLYHPDSVEIAQLAGKLFELGWEPKHLKVMLHAADRNADLINQLLGPLLRKRRKPTELAESKEILTECVETLSQMHKALLTFQAKSLLE